LQLYLCWTYGFPWKSFFFFQAEDGIRDFHVTGVQTCALPIYRRLLRRGVSPPDAMTTGPASTLLDLRGLLLPELEGFVERLGEPRYRGRQVARWLYVRGAAAVDEMTDLPRAFRDRLAEGAKSGSLA